MTRETKIGLLVGLAFIIVIGILLSDHLTASNEAPQAALANAGNVVRQAVTTPGGAGASAPVTIVAPPVTPQQPITTQGELARNTPPVQIVHIGGPSESAGDAAAQPAVTTPSKVADKSDEPADAAKPVDTDAPANSPIDSLQKVAGDNGEAIVPSQEKPQPARVAARTAVARTYTAAAGDSVSKIVAKMMGSSNKSNIEKFCRANPSLGGDPSKLLAGVTYTIPASATAAAAPTAAPAAPVADDSADASAGTPPPAEANTDADEAVKSTAKPASDSQYVYVVKPGDNLTKIARQQLGDAGAVAAIEDLNADKLKGAHHDIVLVGMKLKLPGKPLAKAD